MSAVQVSRKLRLALEAQFASVFNNLLAAACTEFGIAGFTINFSGGEGPQNFYRGERTIESLVAHQEPELPALAMWVGEGQNQNIEKPRKFAGPVAVYWRFWLMVTGIRTAGLTDLREAVEAAMVDTLDPELPGLGYRGDLEWKPLGEQQLFNQDEQHLGWVQQITYSASFEVCI